MGVEDRIRLPALNLIHRRLRLLNLLTGLIETGQRLITVYAPSGFGKSILLADFAQHTDLPVCWCSLAEADRDPTSFLDLLSRSIADRFHEIQLADLCAVVKLGDTQSSVCRIAERLSKVGPHIIILDDFHKANTAGVTLALNWLLEQLPETSTLIVAARGDMGLETAQILDLVMSGRVSGLSEEELRFIPRELKALMLKRFGTQINDETAEELARRTDGNIAQILMTGHAMHAGNIISSLRSRLGDDREVIYGYLAEEVLSKQPPELRQFLLHTAVLPDMTAELCNALLETGNAQACIEELVRRELFISQTGASFRYHDLFAEFLRTKLAEDGDLKRRVCMRAAHLLDERERHEEAMNLYLSASAWSEASSVLEANAHDFYGEGRISTLNDWLERFPDSELARHPQLLLWRGRILTNDMGQPRPAMAAFEQAETQFLEQGDLSGAAEACVLQSVALRMMGLADESVTMASKALSQLEPIQAGDRVAADAIRNCGVALGEAGRTLEALSNLSKALKLYQELGEKYRVGWCHHEIGAFLCQQGNIPGAEHHFKQAILIWQELGNANDLANTLNSLGVHLCSVGRYEEALRYFQDALAVAHRIKATRRIAFVEASIGDVYLACREYEQAAEAYQRSTEAAREADVRRLEIYNLAKTGEGWLGRHDLGQALKLASRARQQAADVGLKYEEGLAAALQARIHARQADYAASFELFEEALEALTGTDVLEQAKVSLWWGHSLLLDMRSTAACEQLQEAIRLALTMGELAAGLGPTIAETRSLLLHALYRPETSAGTRDSIRLLLDQCPDKASLTTASLHVFTFGPPMLVVAGERKQFSQRGRVRHMPEFLAYLLLKSEEGGCRWGEVCAAIWPDLGSDKASVIFHQTLKRLRDGIFGTHDYIIVQNDYYQVNPQYLEWCDALAFERLFERAARATPEEALPLQLELIGVYQGEFLAGFEVSSWGEAYRAWCEERFLQVVNLAAGQLLANDAPQDALNVINKGLAQDYFREDLHHAALQAYAQLGLYDHLRTHYNQLDETFKRELGAPPDPAVALLYRQLTGGRHKIKVQGDSPARSSPLFAERCKS